MLAGEGAMTLAHCPHMHLLLQVWVLIFRACSVNLAMLIAMLAVICASTWAGSFRPFGVTTTVGWTGARGSVVNKSGALGLRTSIATHPSRCSA